MNRRKFLHGMMAGGTVVAGELWIPGQKLISIPSGKAFTGYDLVLEEDIRTLQIMDTMPGDRVRVLTHYGDSPDPVEYIVKNVIGGTLEIKVPAPRDGGLLDAHVITARPGDLYSRFVTIPR